MQGVGAFAECVAAAPANLYATLSFFGGMLGAWLLMLAVHALEAALARRRQAREPSIATDTHQMQGEMRQWMQRSRSTEELVPGAGSEPAMEFTVLPSVREELDALEAVIQAQSGNDKKRLILMTTFAGIAIAAHNLPEGIAVFVGATADDNVGVTLAIAIALHNIPEVSSRCFCACSFSCPERA